MSIAEEKALARAQATERRKAAHESKVSGAAELLAYLEGHAGKPLAGYYPIGTEASPLPALGSIGLNAPLCLPVVLGPNQPLEFRRWGPGSAMEEGSFGVPIPVRRDTLEPEVLIVPLLAYDRRGYRLGYGGGFYDRTLEQLRSRRPTLAIGFAYAAQEVDKVPTEPTDQPLDLIITENGPLKPLKSAESPRNRAK